MQSGIKHGDKGKIIAESAACQRAKTLGKPSANSAINGFVAIQFTNAQLRLKRLYISKQNLIPQSPIVCKNDILIILQQSVSFVINNLLI